MAHQKHTLKQIRNGGYINMVVYSVQVNSNNIFTCTIIGPCILTIAWVLNFSFGGYHWNKKKTCIILCDLMLKFNRFIWKWFFFQMSLSILFFRADILHKSHTGCIRFTQTILYTGLLSPSVIFAIQNLQIVSPCLEFP